MAQRLYKYKAVSNYYNENGVSINRDIENLLAEQLWVSSLEGMNDPLECGFFVNKSLDLGKISEFQQSLLRSYACISFSTSVKCRRLWNYYTDGMRGMVIEYSDSSIRRALKKDFIQSKLYEEETTSGLSLEGNVKSGNIVKFTPDGRRLISARNNIIRVWNLESRESSVLEGHVDIVLSVSFSPDGRQVASGADDSTVRIWDLESGESRVLEGHAGGVNSVAYSPDGRQVASGADDSTVRIWDLESGESRVLEGHVGGVMSVAYSPDGRQLISGSDDSTVRIWDLESGESHVMEGHVGSVSTITVSSDGKLLVSGSYDSTICIWSLATYELLYQHNYESGPILSLTISPNGRIIAVAYADNTIRLLNTNDFNRTLTLVGHTDWVNVVEFLQDSERCISASYDNSIRIWDTSSGKCLHVFKDIHSTIDSIASSRDGNRCVYISSDGLICMIDLKTLSITRIIDTASDDEPENANNKLQIKTAIKEKIAYEGKVIYDGKKTELSNQYKQFLDKQTGAINIDIGMLFHKDDSWEDEKEYRFAFNFGYLVNHRLSNIKPTAIYLGYRMSKENVDIIRRYCESNMINLYMYTPNFYSSSAKSYNRKTLFDSKKTHKN